MALGKQLQTALSVSRRVSLLVGALAVSCLATAMALMLVRLGTLPVSWQPGLLTGLVSETLLLLLIVAVGFVLMRKSLALMQGDDAQRHGPQDGDDAEDDGGGAVFG